MADIVKQDARLLSSQFAGALLPSSKHRG
jgi:hypothetical protein